MFHSKSSSYWGTPISGNPHIPGSGNCCRRIFHSSCHCGGALTCSYQIVTPCTGTPVQEKSKKSLSTTLGGILLTSFFLVLRGIFPRFPVRFLQIWARQPLAALGPRGSSWPPMKKLKSRERVGNLWWSPKFSVIHCFFTRKNMRIAQQFLGGDSSNFTKHPEWSNQTSGFFS